MSNKLWEYFIQDDVERFQRSLANATFAGPRAAGGSGGTSRAATNLSSKTGSPGSMIASSPNPPRSKKNTESSPSSSVPDRTAFPRGSANLSRADVNARDHYGRTLLHHVASSSKPTAFKFAHALLEIRFIDIYAQDWESGWTALHRALYAGNATIALALMARDLQDMTDFSKGGNTSHPSGGLIKIKDREGCSPFDVFGATIRARDIKHLSEKSALKGTVNISADEVFTLGSNKNLNLGLGDQDDRQFPERISLKRPEHLLRRFYREYQEKLEHLGLEDSAPKSKSTELPTLIRNKPMKLQDIIMSKLHTAIITDDPEANLFMCGFGPGGRLGTGDESTRFTFVCIETGGLEGKKVVSAALGQDHSLAITEQGEIFSWGSNKFGQLGYGLPRTSNKNDIPVQTTPRQIFNPFKKETILGAAASSIHSVVFSTSGLYTFGKNEGQLGLVDSDARSLEVQTTPRRVGASLFSCPIKMVSAIDRATSVLLQNHEVWVFSSYGYSKLSFPLEVSSRFIRDSFMATRYDKTANRVVRIVCGGNTICALSSSGDVFTVQVNQSDNSPVSTSTTNPAKIRNSLSAPVRAWSVKKSYMAASDVDVGQDGSIIICTTSGSAWRKERRTKNKEGASKEYKFARIPGLSRAVAVRSNAFGAYAIAQRECEVTREQIHVGQSSLWDDMLPLSPFTMPVMEELDSILDDDAQNVPLVLSSGKSIQRAILSSSDVENQFLPVWTEGTVWVTSSLSDSSIPVHEFLIAGRSPVLGKALAEFRRSYYSSVPDVFDIEYGKDGHPQICLQGVDSLTVMNVAFFLYADGILDVWRLAKSSPANSARFRQVRTEVMRVSMQLGLPALERAARLMVEPQRSLKTDMAHAINHSFLFDSADVTVQLKDDTIKVHSQVVCQRCPFFDTLFHGYAGGRWLDSRKAESDQSVHVDLKHIDRSTFEFVLRYLYADTEERLFDEVRTKDLDDFIDLLLDVMFVANELMIDRLSQVCQKMLGRFVTTRNVCYLLNSIAPCCVTEFKDAALEYICLNLEAMLANRYLEDLDTTLLGELDLICRENQLACWPISRGRNSEEYVFEKYPEIVSSVEADKQRRIDAMTLQSRLGRLEDYDVPARSTPNVKATSSPSVRKGKASVSGESPNVGGSPMLKPRQSTGDLMFQMDDEALMSPSNSKGKGAMRGLRFTEGIPENQSHPDSPALGASVPEAESLGDLGSLKDQMSSLPDSLLAQSPSEFRANTRNQKQALASNTPSAPWTSPMISSSKKDIKDIMGEALQSRVSNLTLGMADRRESSGSFVPKISQKERKKRQQQQMQEQLAAEQKAKDARQNPWQKPATSSPASLPRLDPLPGQSAPASEAVKSTQQSMTMRQTVAGTPPPNSKPVATPVQTQRRSVSGNPQPSPLSKPISPQPAIQSIRHIPRPDLSASRSPSSGSYSLSTILLQQQTEKEAIREAATAKHKMHEIQAEQEFQQWWDQESKRVQGLVDPEPNEPRSGKDGRGGKAPGAAGGQRKRRGNKNTGDGPPQDHRRASAQSSGHTTPKTNQSGQAPAQSQKGPNKNRAGGTNANGRRGGGNPRGRGKNDITA
ncbi:Pc12g10880 [Penicillium rubens Wisconsin 54-1255]|uniref:Pc12g10880 protein n=1 Tax=Penicillium rubens (strain ATCC 28089 / DSM 1075 / NRRL 1951 / Wisconsin 54-1255) TaxID=500485 RepID=B6H110_PENRW|nr:Pc12g10880 [Penicillium rubens Wisconsin 54-1255]